MRTYIGEEIGRLRRKLTDTNQSHRRHLRNPRSAQRTLSISQTSSVSAVPRAALLRLTHKLSGLNVEQRRALTGIGPRRAEIIVAGAHVFAELFTELELTSFRYLPFGLRDGILAQMATDIEDIGLRPQLENERQNSILNLAAHYNVDMPTPPASPSTRSASSNFLTHASSAARVCHLLHAAAMLHEVGSFISRADAAATLCTSLRIRIC